MGSRNKFSSLNRKYSSLIEYIEAQLSVVCIQMDDDIFDSLFSIIKHNYNFEEMYPILDETTIYEGRDNILAPVFAYENKKH